MALFWLVHDIDGERRVRIQEAGALIFARLHAAIDGFTGTFVEAHALDNATAAKVPRRVIGEMLNAGEAAALLDRIAGAISQTAG